MKKTKKIIFILISVCVLFVAAFVGYRSLQKDPSKHLTVNIENSKFIKCQIDKKKNLVFFTYEISITNDDVVGHHFAIHANMEQEVKNGFIHYAKIGSNNHYDKTTTFTAYKKSTRTYIAIFVGDYSKDLVKVSGVSSTEIPELQLTVLD